MRRWKALVVCILAVLCCFPVSALAAEESPQGGTTDVYVGVTTVTKSNMMFLVVDESENPIDGASIEIWANEELKYQLLGVSHKGGIYETTMPYGDYPYRVYKAGYETAEQELRLPGKESPHIEKVILKKEKPKAPDGDQEGGKGDGNQANGSPKKHQSLIKTGDDVRGGMYLFLAGVSAALLILVIIIKQNYISKKN